MRIVYYADNFYPELSGITDTIITTGKELKKRGHEIAYVGPYYSPKDYAVGKRQFPLKKEDDTIDGRPVVRLPTLPMPISPTSQSRIAIPSGTSFDLIKEFKPDVIHTQSPYGVGGEALKAARAFTVPLVGTNHTAIEDFFPFGMRAIMRQWDARYYNHCTLVTAPYQKLIERMREVGFTRPGRALANPAELSSFSPASTADRAEQARSFGLTGPVVLYAGRLGSEKRVDVIIRALPALLREVRTLTFVATGHGAAAKSLRKLAQNLGVGKNVHFTGYLPRTALPHAYKAADVFAMMSTPGSQSIAPARGGSPTTLRSPADFW